VKMKAGRVVADLRDPVQHGLPELLRCQRVYRRTGQEMRTVSGEVRVGSRRREGVQHVVCVIGVCYWCVLLVCDSVL